MRKLPDSNSDVSDDSIETHDRGSVTSTPRWVKVFGIIAIVLVLLFVIMMLTGNHGPGRHIPSGDAGGHTTPITVTEVHTPPEGGH